MIFDLSSQVWYFLIGKYLIITTENWKFAYLSVFLSNLVLNWCNLNDSWCMFWDTQALRLNFKLLNIV